MGRNKEKINEFSGQGVTSGSNAATRRIDSLDVVKGVLILLVFFHHVTWAPQKVGIWHLYFDYVAAFISLYGPFFMTAFFVVSGIVLNLNKSFISVLRKDIKRLLLPCFIYTFVFRLLDHIILGKEFDLYSIATSIVNHAGDYWFVTALFLAKTYLYIIDKIVKNAYYSLILALSILVLGVYLYSIEEYANIWVYKHSLVALFFVSLGHYMKEKIMKRNLRAFSCFIFFYLIATIGLMLLRYNTPWFAYHINITISNAWLFVLLATTGSYALLQLCILVKKCEFLEWFGRNSLSVYLVHMGILKYASLLISMYLINVNSGFNAIMFLILLSVICIGLSVFVIRLINIFCPWSLGR